ncbi:TolC family protein [Gemmata sp.]|uniref:TolC family protein n=1 Tax=Gemmata sp. TaxID=1914242 RepID=UPI003F727F8D
MSTRHRLWFRLAGGALGTALVVSGSGMPPAGAQVPGTGDAGEKAPAPRPAFDPPPGTILAPGEAPIDLDTALRLAGAENPELLLARQRVVEATALRQLAAAQVLPNLNVGTNYNGHEGALQQSTGNILKVNRDSLYLGLGAGAVGSGTVTIPGLNYNLNVGAGWFGFLSARQRVTTAAAVADAVRNDVLLRVCLAYTDLLRAEGRRAIATKNRAEGAELARLTAVYAKTRQGRQADADRAMVELKRRDADLTQAEADTLTASARLCQLLNLDPSTRLKAIEGWVVPAALVPDPVPLAELLAIALLQRPELAARRSEVRETLYELSLAKVLPFSPTMVLGFSAGGFGGGSNLVSDPPGFVSGNGTRELAPRFSSLDNRTDFDVAVFWTFRNLGVGNVALVRATDSRVRQSRLRELDTINLVRTQVAESHARVLARAQQIDAAERAVRASTEAFDEDLKRIRGGQGLPLEVIDSMRLLARSRYEYLDAIVDYNRAQFQLWVSLGRPPANALARPVPVAPPVAVGPRVTQLPSVVPAAFTRRVAR